MTNYWIQNSDFSTAKEGPANSPQNVIEAFNSYNWEQQLERFQHSESEAQDCCPPGLGVVKEPGVILHLLPNADGTAWGHLHTQTPRKIFGFIPSTRAKVFTFDDVKPAQIPNVITRFIKGDEVWLNKNLREKD